MHRKILFLDFDGVICTSKTDFCMDNDKLALLEQIVAATDCYIVISSSWRRYTLEATIEHITAGSPYLNGVPFRPIDRVIDVTARMYAFKYGANSDEHYKVPRGVEIDRWLHEHADEVSTYCIVDDAPNMLLSQKDNFVHIDDEHGLNGAHVRQIIDILNDDSRIY